MRALWRWDLESIEELMAARKAYSRARDKQTADHFTELQNGLKNHLKILFNATKHKYNTYEKQRDKKLLKYQILVIHHYLKKVTAPKS
jgi:hypothetical protein